MEILSKNFEDSRGYILDIMYSQNFNHATLIYSKKGSTRGNHYHKKTTQITFVLSGEVRYYYKLKNKKTASEKLIKNSFLITKPLEIHAYKFIKNTKMLILSKGLRGGKDYEKDTFRKKII